MKKLPSPFIPSIIFVILAFMGRKPVMAGNSSQPDFKQPVLKTAIARSDNDIAITDDKTGMRVSLPIAVAKEIHKLALNAYGQRVDWIRKQGGALEFPALKESYGPIFRLDAPHKRHLYLFKLMDRFDFTCYLLLLHDPLSKRLTKEPPCIQGKWTEMMQRRESTPMKRPYLFFDDLNLDQEPELVIQEQVHNGTTYNAVVYHYFHIGTDLSLNQILALETRLIDLFSEKESGLIIRTIEKLGPNRIKILVSIENSTGAKRTAPVGEILLESPDAATPFAIKSKTALVEKYEGLLVTGSEEDEAEFIGKGHSLYY